MSGTSSPAEPSSDAGGAPLDARLAGLIERATRFDGHPPFSDGSLVALRTGLSAVVWHDDVAAAIVSEHEAELVVDPEARRQGHGQALLHRLLMDAPGDLFLWAHGAHPAALVLANRFGLEPVRQLLQLRLHLAEVATCVDASGETSTQVATSRRLTSGLAGHEDAWLELNARAFAAHPEQGAVTRADLDVLMNEDWFVDDDVLLLWHGDALVGYCWLKVMRDSGGAGGVSTSSTSDAPVSTSSTSGAAQVGAGRSDVPDLASSVGAGGAEDFVFPLAPPRGEFYVVGVDPDRQGEGIGRELVAAGLGHLRARSIPIAHLYVEGDNTAAVRLYRSFGFTDYALDVQYRWRSEPVEPLDDDTSSAP